MTQPDLPYCPDGDPGCPGAFHAAKPDPTRPTLAHEWVCDTCGRPSQQAHEVRCGLDRTRLAEYTWRSPTGLFHAVLVTPVAGWEEWMACQCRTGWLLMGWHLLGSKGCTGKPVVSPTYCAPVSPGHGPFVPEPYWTEWKWKCVTCGLPPEREYDEAELPAVNAPREPAGTTRGCYCRSGGHGYGWHVRAWPGTGCIAEPREPVQLELFDLVGAR